MKSLRLAAVLLPAIVAIAACAGPDSATGGVAAGQYESGSGSRTTQATNQMANENRNRMLVDYARGY